ncbi:unnamed protein product, partial [Plutella xylostella]
PSNQVIQESQKKSQNEYQENTDNKKDQNLYICTWNIRSLVKDTRHLELKHSLEKFKWDIIGLSEVKMEGREILECEDYIFIYNGEKSGRNGVGFLLRKELKSYLTDIKTISDRVIRLDMCLNNQTVHLIQCYAPTESSTIEELDMFYKNLRDALINTSKNTIVMGDFNSKIGFPTAEDRTVMGPWGYGERNERGKILIQFCFENQLYITNTHFKKNYKQKWTWISPDGKTRNEIDFILIKNIQNVSNVEVLNSNFPSDHRLIRASITNFSGKAISRKHYRCKMSGLNPLEQESLKNILSEELDLLETRDMQLTYTTLIQKIKEAVNRLPKERNNDKPALSPYVEKVIIERNRLKNKEKRTRSEKNKLSALYKLIKKQIKRDLKEHRYRIIEEELEKDHPLKGHIKG